MKDEPRTLDVKRKTIDFKDELCSRSDPTRNLVMRIASLIKSDGSEPNAFDPFRRALIDFEAGLQSQA